MNDNFWFNDSAFNGPPTNQSNDDDFFNSFIERPLNQFSQNPQSPAPGTGQQQQHPGPNTGTGTGMGGIPSGQGSPDGQNFMLNTVDPLMYVNRGQQQSQGLQGAQNLQQNLLVQPQARSRQPLGQNQPVVTGLPGASTGQQRRQSQTQLLAQVQNDPGKRDQVLKIRQQIMHQQMLQSQKKQKLGPQSPAVNNTMAQQGIPRQTDSPDGGFSPAMWQQQQQQQQQQQNQRQAIGANLAGVNTNLGSNTPGIGSNGPGIDLSSPNINGQPQRQRSIGNSQSQMKQGTTPTAYGSPATTSNVVTPGASGAQFSAQKPGKPSPQQQAQMQMELFMATLQDFMTKRGTPIFQAPMINGKKINLFFLLLMCLKFGGSQRLLKAPTQGPSPWSVISQKLGIVDGIDPNDIATRSKYEKELIHLYMQILVPYEQYLATPEGDKEFQQRRQHFQQQMLLRSQGQQQQNHPVVRPGLVLAQQMQKQRDSPRVNLPMASNHASPAQFVNTPSAITQQSPALSLAQTPQQRNLSRMSHSSHDLPVVPKPSQPQPQLNQQQAQVVSRPASGDAGANLAIGGSSSATPKPDNQNSKDPTAYRVYAPIRRSLETYGGLDVRALLAVAGEIEITKPVFLFAPELGSVNIHALTMALKTYDGTPSGEVLSALNTLLVTTSDANLAFKLTECPELLDSLLDLGVKVLNRIISPKGPLKNAPEDAAKASGASHIENVFSKYAKEPSADELQEEDIAFVVDSLTGELVEEEDDDDDDDDSIFLPSKDDVSPVDDDTILAINDFDEVHLKSYMETLLDFRAENKHHFSKIQTKSATDERVYFVDELITITMILRNILFADANGLFMASNEKFKKLIFAIVKVAATTPSKFILARKRLCLLKDCLLLLNKISFSLELRSLEETFLSYLLLTLFGVKIESPDELYYANLDTYSYLLFGIDAFTKLLVREPYNRLLLQAVLTGNLSISSLQGATFTSTSLNISTKDQKETAHLIDGFFKNYPQGSAAALKNGELLTTSFQFFLSVLPLHLNTLEISKFFIIRSPTVSQALFGAKIVLDLIVNGEGLGLRELACDWLIKFKEPLLQNLVSVCLSLAIDNRDINRHSHEHKVLSLVILKLLILVNTLLTNAIYCVGLPELSDLKRIKLSLIAELAKISPEKEATLDALLNPAVDDDIGKEVLRLVEALRELKADDSVAERRQILEDIGVAQQDPEDKSGSSSEKGLVDSVPEVGNDPAVANAEGDIDLAMDSAGISEPTAQEINMEENGQNGENQVNEGSERIEQNKEDGQNQDEKIKDVENVRKEQFETDGDIELNDELYEKSQANSEEIAVSHEKIDDEVEEDVKKSVQIEKKPGYQFENQSENQDTELSEPVDNNDSINELDNVLKEKADLPVEAPEDVKAGEGESFTEKAVEEKAAAPVQNEEVAAE